MNRLIKLLPALALFALVLFAPAETRADALAITGGTASLSSPFHTVPRYITSGVNISGSNFQAVGGQLDGPSQGLHHDCTIPCPAGSSFSINTTTSFSSNGGNGLFTLDGTSRFGLLGVTLTFNTGAVTIPLDATTNPGQLFTLSTTFTATGGLSFIEDDPVNGLTGFTYNNAVFGSGIADISIFFSGTTHDYQIGGVTYRFQPDASTPEPATLILLGTGLAGAAAWRKRRKVMRSDG